MVLVKVAYYAISTARLFMLRITLVVKILLLFLKVFFSKEKNKKSKLCIVSFGNIT